MTDQDTRTPEIEEQKPIEQEEKVIEDPVIKDAKVSDHNETDNDLPFEESLGKKDFISDAPFDGPSTNAAIGIGGGAGGAFGGRGGHRNLRAEGGGASIADLIEHGVERGLAVADQEDVDECCHRLGMRGGRPSGDDQRVGFRPLRAPERDLPELQDLKDVGICELVLKREAQNIELPK